MAAGMVMGESQPNIPTVGINKRWESQVRKLETEIRYQSERPSWIVKHTEQQFIVNLYNFRSKPQFVEPKPSTR